MSFQNTRHTQNSNEKWAKSGRKTIEKYREGKRNMAKRAKKTHTRQKITEQQQQKCNNSNE